MTRGGHEMDRFQNLEEYVRRSAPSPERDAESSLPDDASMTDEQLDALDAMGDEAEGSWPGLSPRSIPRRRMKFLTPSVANILNRLSSIER